MADKHFINSEFISGNTPSKEMANKEWVKSTFLSENIPSEERIVAKNQFTLEWVVGLNDEGKSVKQFLQENHLSKTALTDIKFQGGDILVNGEHVTVRHILKQGEKLQIIFPKEEISAHLKSEHIPLTIIYEDPYVLIINKPANMNTIPSHKHPTGSLANALLGYYERINHHASPHIVTRLDRNTSGLVLIAKYRHIHSLLAKAQQSGQVKRSYIAIVEGVMQNQEGTIIKPIARKPGSIIERTVSESGQYAKTYYRVLKQYQDYAKIYVQLETGRTHQIRVHMSYLGHPLLGDELYGGNTEKIKRQALHCQELSFYHPFQQKLLSFTCPLPDDLKNLLKED